MSLPQALETVPSYPDICFAIDDYDDVAFDSVVRNPSPPKKKKTFADVAPLTHHHAATCRPVGRPGTRRARPLLRGSDVCARGGCRLPPPRGDGGGGGIQGIRYKAGKGGMGWGGGGEEGETDTWLGGWGGVDAAGSLFGLRLSRQHHQIRTRQPPNPQPQNPKPQT